MTRNLLPPSESDRPFQDGARPDSHPTPPDALVDSGHRTPSQKSQKGWFSGKVGLAAGIGLGLLMGAATFGRRSAPTAPAPTESVSAAAAQAVTVAEVELSSVSRTLEATGTVEAYDLLPILPRASGLQVQRVLVDEGDRVSAGQVLAVLDRALLEAQLTEAQADLEATQARVRQQEAALTQADARLSEARAQVGRYESLAAEGAISTEALETRATAAITAQEDLRVAQANLSSARAEVRSRQAQSQQLQTQLEQTQVKAPASGLVAERMARVGDVTSSTTQLFSIIRDRLLELQVDVPETQLPQVSVGATVTVTSDADPRIQLSGTVREIAPLIDSDTRDAAVFVDLPPSDLLRPGMFLRAAITTSTATGLTVPAQAVIPRADGTATVYRVEGGEAGDEAAVAQAVTVELGELLDSADPALARIEITSGLSQGDRIVAQGAGYVNSGDVVDVVADNVSD